MLDKKTSSNTRMTHFKVKKHHYLCNWHYKEENTCNFKYSIKNLIKKRKSIKEIQSIFITKKLVVECEGVPKTYDKIFV
jgi:hypothetical protein